jgi:hypothetical protein
MRSKNFIRFGVGFILFFIIFSVILGFIFTFIRDSLILNGLNASHTLHLTFNVVRFEPEEKEKK